MAESARTTEADWHKTLGEENGPTQKSLEMLRIRLAQTNRDLTQRQAEILLLGATYVRNYGGNEYTNNKDFIDQIIEMASQAEKTED